MGLDDVIEAYDPPQGSAEPHGIIYKIREQVTNDKIIDYITPTSNVATNKGDINYIVTWNGGWQSSNSDNAYFQVEFKDHYVFPTHYSIKGFSGKQYAKSWELYGLNSLSEAPTFLSRNTSVGSTYCGDCSEENWGTFVINNAPKSFRYFRFSIKEGILTNYYFIALKGFEIFGVFLKTPIKPKKTYCYKSIPINSHMRVDTFLRLFCIYLSTN